MSDKFNNNPELQAEPWFQGLFLFKELVKLGAEWQGDICSSKWSECLIVNCDFYRVDDIKEYLTHYREGMDYKLEGSFDTVKEKGIAIWIA